MSGGPKTRTQAKSPSKIELRKYVQEESKKRNLPLTNKQIDQLLTDKDFLKELVEEIRINQAFNKLSSDKQSTRATKITQSFIRKAQLDNLRMGNPNINALSDTEEGFERLLAYKNFIPIKDLRNLKRLFEYLYKELQKQGKSFQQIKRILDIYLKTKVFNELAMNGKRFKAPHNFEKFKEEVELIQKEYPQVIKEKKKGEAMNKRLKGAWKKGAAGRYEIISVFKKIARKINSTETTARKKVERIKKGGFL